MTREDVRRHADWLTQADERIMELLLDAGSHPSSALAHKLNDISTGIEYHREYVGQRCRKLAEYGLLEKEYSHYKLSEKGQQYLDGELDTQQLEATESE